MDQVTVKVPATTGNLGPGFDCLGMALDVWNTVHVRLGESGFDIRGEGEDKLKRGRSNLVYRSFRLACEAAGRPVPGVRVTCENQIPLARGLGSSSAAVVAGLVAGNEICGKPLSDEQLLELAAKTEGHPDNVAPALLGGCQIVVSDDGNLVTSKVPVPPDLRAVLFIPEIPMPTKQARSVLSQNVPRKDAVYNLGRVALLISGLTAGDLSDFTVATKDRLHQPARETIFPAMKVIFRAALSAGALGVFLSGAGSTVLALARDREMSIGYEMAEAASKSGVRGDVKITQPTNEGAQVVTPE